MTEPCKAPFERSYWVVPGQFLAGFYPGDLDRAVAESKLTSLLGCGIRCLVNLMPRNELDHEGHLFAPYDRQFRRLGAAQGVEVAIRRLPIRDGDVPTRTTMRRILDTIDGCIDRGCPVYVHCWGGVGRTGTVVGCWLARHGFATGDAAIARIAEMRRGDLARRDRLSPETEAQRELVRSWRPGE